MMKIFRNHNVWERKKKASSSPPPPPLPMAVPSMQDPDLFHDQCPGVSIPSYFSQAS